MSQWITMADGQVINFENVKQIVQLDKALVSTFIDGSTARVDFPDATSAATALAAVQLLLGTSASAQGISYLTPNSAPGGGGTVVSVAVGFGFSQDLVGANWDGTIVIGGTSATFVYVNDTTILLTWASGAPGTVDVVYTTKGGQVFTLHSYFVYE